MEPANRIQNIQEYYFSKKMAEVRKMKQEGIDVINLGIGSPDLPPHPDVIHELNKISKQPESNMYQSYRGVNELRVAFSKWYERVYKVNLKPETQILPLMGSKEGIMHISMAFCDAGDRILVPNPGYPAYSAVSKLLNLDTQYYHLTEQNNWLPNFEELESLYNEKCKIIWINYPHMPSGTAVDNKTLRDLVMWAKYRGVLIVNDNPYSLILNEKPQSILSNLEQYKDILELNSLSKSHNMAGWRVGVLGGASENIHQVLKVKSNFDSGMYKAVQLAAVKALSLDASWYTQLNQEYTERRQIVWNILESLGCQYNKESCGLFVWAKIPRNFNNSYEFSDYLLNTLCVFAAPGGIFGDNGDHYIRLSLCANQNALLNTFKRVKNLKATIICE